MLMLILMFVLLRRIPILAFELFYMFCVHVLHVLHIEDFSS